MGEGAEKNNGVGEEVEGKWQGIHYCYIIQPEKTSQITVKQRPEGSQEMS